MAKIIWRRPHRISGEIGTPNVLWTPESLHSKQQLDLFSRFCRAQACDRQTDRQTDRQRDGQTGMLRYGRVSRGGCISVNDILWVCCIIKLVKLYVLLPIRWIKMNILYSVTKVQSDLAKAVSNPKPLSVGRSGLPPSNTMFHWPPRVFTRDRTLKSSAIFAQWSRVEPRDRQTDGQTPRTSVTIVCISCIRCSLIINAV